MSLSLCDKCVTGDNVGMTMMMMGVMMLTVSVQPILAQG